MRMKVDILNYTIEEVLLIECKNEQWRPVVYLLKFLNEIERNYKIYIIRIYFFWNQQFLTLSMVEVYAYKRLFTVYQPWPYLCSFPIWRIT